MGEVPRIGIDAGKCDGGIVGGDRGKGGINESKPVSTDTGKRKLDISGRTSMAAILILGIIYMY